MTVNLLANSFIGMADPNQAQNDTYDAGKFNNNINPFAPNVTGAILVMQGNITGSNFDLTKTGSDVVILSGTGKMKPVAGITDMQADDIVAYVKTLK